MMSAAFAIAFLMTRDCHLLMFRFMFNIRFKLDTKSDLVYSCHMSHVSIPNSRWGQVLSVVQPQCVDQPVSGARSLLRLQWRRRLEQQRLLYSLLRGLISHAMSRRQCHSHRLQLIIGMEIKLININLASSFPTSRKNRKKMKLFAFLAGIDK